MPTVDKYGNLHGDGDGKFQQQPPREPSPPLEDANSMPVQSSEQTTDEEEIRAKVAELKAAAVQTLADFIAAVKARVPSEIELGVSVYLSSDVPDMIFESAPPGYYYDPVLGWHYEDQTGWEYVIFECDLDYANPQASKLSLTLCTYNPYEQDDFPEILTTPDDLPEPVEITLDDYIHVVLITHHDPASILVDDGLISPDDPRLLAVLDQED